MPANCQAEAIFVAHEIHITISGASFVARQQEGCLVCVSVCVASLCSASVQAANRRQRRTESGGDDDEALEWKRERKGGRGRDEPKCGWLVIGAKTGLNCKAREREREIVCWRRLVII